MKKLLYVLLALAVLVSAGDVVVYRYMVNLPKPQVVQPYVPTVQQDYDVVEVHDPNVVVSSGPVNPDKLIRQFFSNEQIRELEDVIPVEFNYIGATMAENGYYIYSYSIARTDAVVVVYLDNGIATIHSITNRYGSIYPIVYFKNGIPSNALDIYKQLDVGGPLTTEYEEGKRVVLYDKNNNKVKLRLNT